MILQVITGLYAAAVTFALIKIRKQRKNNLARQEEALTLKKRRLHDELITSITRSFGACEETGVLINNALMMTALYMGASRAFLACVNSETGVIFYEYQYSEPKQNIKNLPHKTVNFSAGNIFYDTFLAKGDAYLLYDCGNNDQRIDKKLMPAGLKSCIYVPVNLYGQFWGAMGIERYHSGPAWEESDAKTMILAASVIRTMLVKADAENALIKAREKAEAGGRAKTNFLSRISREIRAPLNEIIGMTNIARNSQDKNDVELCLTKVNEASMHMLRIINDVLDMTKIETGNFELSVEEFEFEKMLKHVTDMIEFKIHEKNQKLIVNFDPLLPFKIIADEQRLIQVLMNILSNASNFTGENGIVAFSVQVQNMDKLCTVRFTVTDTGAGISEEVKNRLFMPFEEADESISLHSGGVGLGLVISKNIIELMGGKIWFESEPDKGSVFTAELPFKEGKLFREKAEPAEKNEQYNLINLFAGKKILVAEDIEINREILHLMLEETRIGIDFAENGKSAIEMFEADPKKYDLILTDIHMPEIDGYEAVRRIRASGGRGKEIPIIAMTANVFKEDIAKCFAAGMNDHIGKPVEITELIKKLIKYLNNS